MPPTKNKSTILEAWELFEALTMPINAGERQRNDMKIAFFAGAGACFKSVVLDLDSTDIEPTEDDLRHVSAVYDELEAFATKVVRDSSVQTRAQ